MKQAFLERASLEEKEVWNLITLYIDDDDKETTQVIPYATKFQAEQARVFFLESDIVLL